MFVSGERAQFTSIGLRDQGDRRLFFTHRAGTMARHERPTTMTVSLGVYCETLAPRELDRPDVLGLLGEFRVTLGHAVRFTETSGAFDPDRVRPYLELGDKIRAAGGGLFVWPLLPKLLGYWWNERNLDAADRLANALLEGIRRHGVAPDGVVLDMEPPWNQAAAVLFPGPGPASRAVSLARYFLENRNPRRFAWSVGRLREIVARLRGTGLAVSSAVIPFLIADLIHEGNLLQDYLETPVFPLPFDGYNAMFYNSYLPIAAAALVPPGAAARCLFEYMRELATLFGDRAWVTLGSTWEGVIPGNAGLAYDRADQLVGDVAAAKAAGIGSLWLFCLEGVLYADQGLTRRREQLDSKAFFSVLRDTPAAEPAAHTGWSRRRRVLEWVTRDRRPWAYGW